MALTTIKNRNAVALENDIFRCVFDNAFYKYNAKSKLRSYIGEEERAQQALDELERGSPATSMEMPCAMYENRGS